MNGGTPYSCLFPVNLADTAPQSFINAPVATNTRMECRIARALYSSPFSTATVLRSSTSLPFPRALAAPLLSFDWARPGGPSMILWTVSTVGARFLRAREREMTYL
jgi:hypothetical protein